MMKQKLVAAFFVFAGLIAFSQTDAQARPHHRKHHHSIHRTAHAHRVVHHVPRGARRHFRRARSAAAHGKPRAWCGWWLGRHVGMPRRDLWLARNWARVGRNAGGPRIGAVVVWRHHVGIITGRAGAKWVVKSGNDGNRVRERPRSISGAIAFRHLGGGATRS